MFFSSYFDAPGKISRFILKKLIGKFLDEDLDLDQLKVHLFKGEVQLFKLKLNPKAIHEAIGVDPDTDYLPFRIRAASLESLRLNFYSWDNTNIHLEGLEITIAPTLKEHSVKADTYKSRKRDLYNSSRDPRSRKDEDFQDARGRADMGDAEISQATQQGLSELDLLLEQVLAHIRIIAKNVRIKITKEEESRETDENANFLFLIFDSIKYQDAKQDRQELEFDTETMKVQKEPVLFDIMKKSLTISGLSIRFKGTGSKKHHQILSTNHLVDIVASVTIRSTMEHLQSPLSQKPPALDADFFVHFVHIILNPKSWQNVEDIINIYVESADAAKTAANAELDYLSSLEAEVSKNHLKESFKEAEKPHSASAKDLELIKSMLPWYEEDKSKKSFQFDGDDNCSISSSLFFDCEDGGGSIHSAISHEFKGRSSRTLSVNSLSSTALLLSPTHSPKKCTTRRQIENTDEQVLLLLKIQVMRLQIELHYSESDDTSLDQFLKQWLIDEEGSDTKLENLRQQVTLKDCAGGERFVFRCENVKVNASFTASETSCTIIGESCYANEMLVMPERELNDELYSSTVFKTKEPTSNGVKTNSIESLHQLCKEKQSFRILYNSQSQPVLTEKALAENTQLDCSIELRFSEIEILWDTEFAQRINRLFDLSEGIVPTASQTFSDGDVNYTSSSRMAFTLISPNVKFIVKIIAPNRRRDEYDNALILDLYNIHFTPETINQEMEDKADTSTFKLSFEKACLRINRCGDVSDDILSVGSNIELKDQIVQPLIKLQTRKPFSDRSSAEAAYLNRIGEDEKRILESTNRVYQPNQEVEQRGENDYSEPCIYEVAKKTTARGLATAETMIWLNFPKARLLFSKDIYFQTLHVIDEFVRTVSVNDSNEELLCVNDRLSEPNQEAFEPSNFTLICDVVEGVAEVEEGEDSFRLEFFDLNLTVVDEAVLLKVMDGSVHEKHSDELVPLAHGCKWGETSPIIQVNVLKQCEFAGEEYETRVSAAMNHIFCHFSPKARWLEVLNRIVGEMEVSAKHEIDEPSFVSVMLKINNSAIGISVDEGYGGILAVGLLTFSTNIVNPSEIQAYYATVNDLGFYLSEEASLSSEFKPSPSISSSRTEFRSILEYAESQLYVQIASLDGVEVFLKLVESVPLNGDIGVDIEFAAPHLMVYTCGDSFSTLCDFIASLSGLSNSGSANTKTGNYDGRNTSTLLNDLSMNAFEPQSLQNKIFDFLLVANLEEEALIDYLETLLREQGFTVTRDFTGVSKYAKAIVLVTERLWNESADHLQQYMESNDWLFLLDENSSFNYPESVTMLETSMRKSIRFSMNERFKNNLSNILQDIIDLAVSQPTPQEDMALFSQNKYEDLVEILLNSEEYCAVLSGMGGSGKTTIAKRVVQHPAIVAKFFHGIVWVQVACENPSWPLLLAQLKAQVKNFSNALIVFDDVWNQEIFKKAEILHHMDRTTSKVLITTRDETLLEEVTRLYTAKHIFLESQTEDKEITVKDDERSAGELRLHYEFASDDQLSASQLRSRYAQNPTKTHEESDRQLHKEADMPQAKWLLDTYTVIEEDIISVSDAEDDYVQFDILKREESPEKAEINANEKYTKQENEETRIDEENDGFDVKALLEKSLCETEELAYSDLMMSNEAALQDMNFAKRMYNRLTGVKREELLENEGIPQVMKHPARTSSSAFWYPNITIRINPHYMAIPYTSGAGSHIPPTSVLEAKLKSMGEIQERLENDENRLMSMRILLRNTNITWRIFGGYDWNSSVEEDSERRSSSVFQVERDESRPSEILGRLLEEEDDDDTKLHKKNQSVLPKIKHPKAKRDLKKMVEFQLQNVSGMVDVYDKPERFEDKPGQFLQSSFALAIQHFDIKDELESSPINKLLSYWVNESEHPRITGSSMLRLAVDMLSSVKEKSTSEYRLRCAVLPLRLNIDQDTADFLIDSFGWNTLEDSRDNTQNSIKTVPDKKRQALVVTTVEHETCKSEMNEKDEESVYFQAVDFHAFKIKIDYWPKRVDFHSLRNGSSMQMINLFAYEGLEVVLRRFQAQGIDGVDGLFHSLSESWKEDILKKQLHKCLAGVALPPFNIVASLGTSLTGLLLIPLDQYRKDGRFIEGFRKSSRKLLKTITVEALSTANKFTGTTQTILEHADDIIMSSAYHDTRITQVKEDSNGLVNFSYGSVTRYSEQPRNIQEGLEQAADSITNNMKRAAQMIIAVPMKEYEQSGTTRAVKSVVRAAPIAVIRPVIGATQAVSLTLLGMLNSVDPEIRHDYLTKYKNKNRS